MNTKGIIFICLLFLSTSVFGQSQQSSSPTNTLNGSDNNELKINLLMSIAGLPEITYERFIADNMGAGVSLAISLDNSLETSAIVLPYYRVYFGSKKASGFFIEGNGAMVVQKQYNYGVNEFGYYISSTSTSNVANFGLGAAVGAKFLTRNGFTGEVYLGLGRLFGDNDGAFPRVGITLGKRF